MWASNLVFRGVDPPLSTVGFDGCQGIRCILNVHQHYIFSNKNQYIPLNGMSVHVDVAAIHVFCFGKIMSSVFVFWCETWLFREGP